MKLIEVQIDVNSEGECAVALTYPPPGFTCVQALQPKETIVRIQKKQADILKRCTEVNDVLPDFLQLVESKYSQLSTRVKATTPLLKRMQADLFAIQKSLILLKRKLVTS